MDNITHSLIGLMTGEAVARATPGDVAALSPKRRRAIIVALAVVSNNLPDVDLLYSSIGGLRYVLDHRGYTHSVVGCAVLALLLYGGVAAWLARRKVPLSRFDHFTFAGVTLGGAALHLLMDSLNSYGVHPFWPFDNHWIYGDSVFIVEPIYWAASAPLIFGLETRTARIVLGLLLAAAVGACFASGLVAEPLPVVFTVLLLLTLAIGRRIGPRAAALTSVGLFVAVTLMFVAAGRAAARRAESAVLADFPGDRLLDHVLSPMPVNPLCWDVLMLEVHEDQYVARHAALALAPWFVSSVACGRGFLDRATLVPRNRLPISPRSGIEWQEFDMPLNRLAKLSAAHCDAAALLQFARAPFALPVPEGWLLGDLRFDNGRRSRMSDINIGRASQATACPPTPPWVPPREDILQGPGS